VLRGVLQKFDDTPERLKCDLARLRGGNDKPFVPQEKAGKYPQLQQTRLAVLTSNRDPDDTMVEVAWCAGVSLEGEMLLPREQGAAEIGSKVDELLPDAFPVACWRLEAR
jgi:hypothetical protein